MYRFYDRLEFDHGAAVSGDHHVLTLEGPIDQLR